MKIKVSNGEIIDKLTILEIKVAKMTDPDKLANVIKEMDELTKSATNLIKTTPTALYKKLYNINIALWEVEDALRLLEKAGLFEKEFINLARSVYKLNDERADIKKDINKTTYSELFEEKSYEKYI